MYTSEVITDLDQKKVISFVFFYVLREAQLSSSLSSASSWLFSFVYVFQDLQLFAFCFCYPSCDLQPSRWKNGKNERLIDHIRPNGHFSFFLPFFPFFLPILVDLPRFSFKPVFFIFFFPFFFPFFFLLFVNHAFYLRFLWKTVLFHFGINLAENTEAIKSGFF